METWQGAGGENHVLGAWDSRVPQVQDKGDVSAEDSSVVQGQGRLLLRDAEEILLARIEAPEIRENRKKNPSVGRH